MIKGAKRKSQSGPLVLFAGIALAILALIWGGVKLLSNRGAQEVKADQVDFVQEIYEPQFLEPDVKYEVKEGDVLSSVFEGHNVPFPEIVALEQTKSDIFSFTSIRPGKEVFIYFYEEGSDFRLKQLVYQPDPHRYIIAEQNHAGWFISEEAVEYDIREVSKSGTVKDSLYLSALEQGLDERVILHIADIFAWDIDFAREVRGGDTYKVVYQEKWKDGQMVTPGKILAAEYVNQGVSFQAYFFEVEEGKLTYFNEKGEALEKAFLRAPVNYRYVSSGFSNARFHPVIGKSIPHKGIDYAANHGVPIISVAAGSVVTRGYHTAYGNQVLIRHNERYTSQYAHMSAFANGLQVGQKVSQGQVIGYVGSTGYSTGPHVHFGMQEYGTFIDPVQIDVPDGEPVPDEMKEEFFAIVNDLSNQLEQL